MNVLIACEESQAVCIEFRKLGHNAFSCDIQESSGGHPEWHFQEDIFKIINGGQLETENKQIVFIDRWQMLIGFPPCTHLASSGAAWFEQKRKDGRQQQGIEFFLSLANAPIDKIAIENPIGIMSKFYKKPTQIIQPFYFGDPVKKSTCLWLKNLSRLNATNIVEPEIITLKTGARFSKWDYDISFDRKNRAKLRSKTFPGIAKAMAQQWGN